MVKTRSQQKIAFPKRKANLRSKSVGKSLDSEPKTSPKTKSRSFIAILTRARRDKSKDVENFEKSRPSPAKKSRTDRESSPVVIQRQNGKIQKENLSESSRRTRRSLSFEEDEENNLKTRVTRNSRSGKQTPTNVTKSSTKPINKIIPDAVHSPLKSEPDVAPKVASPLKCSVRLERTEHKKLTTCKSTGYCSPTTLEASPLRKRRHSSSDFEKHAGNRKSLLADPGFENLTRNRTQLLCLARQEENNLKTRVTRKSRSGKQTPTNVTKSSTKPINKIIPDAVHSPLKSEPDVAPKVASPLKCSVRLERTVHKKLTACKSTGYLLPMTLEASQLRKRRHSCPDNEKLVLPGNRKSLLADPGLENLTSNRTQLLCLARQEGQAYKETKHVLHSSIPSNLLCRETETKQIEAFLKVHLVHRRAGSQYISGAPGTGKTACLTHILENLQKDGMECHVQFINCMNLSKSHRIYSKIAEELMGWDRLTNNEAQKFLEKKFTGKGPPIVLVLDEIDQLESKNQDVLYTMFEWPSLPASKLILIGIANALDLTDRILPRLQLRPECKPKLLHFSPYSKDQIVKILTARLSEVEGSNIVDVSAVQFCARKIAAVSGDMRKALDICRRAVEVVETEAKRQQVLKPIDLSASPKKSAVKKVTIAHVSKVILEVYGSRIVNSCGGEQPTIPLQQKLLICTILLMQKESKLREIPVGQLHETYCSICKKRQVSQISQEDCLSLCNLLESRGIISMKRAKETRMTKVSLKIDEREVDHALQDKILMTSILQGGLSPNC